MCQYNSCTAGHAFQAVDPKEERKLAVSKGSSKWCSASYFIDKSMLTLCSVKVFSESVLSMFSNVSKGQMVEKFPRKNTRILRILLLNFQNANHSTGNSGNSREKNLIEWLFV